MLLAPIVEGLQEDLMSTAAVGDDQTRRAAELLVSALGPAMRLRLMEVVHQAVEEIDASLAGASVEIRLIGRDPVLTVEEQADEAVPVGHITGAGSGAAAGESETGPGAAEDGMARITLRMPESLKTLVEQAADRAGASVNTWLVNAAAQAVRAPFSSRRTPRRITGFVRG